MMPGRPTAPEQGRPERIAPHPHTGFVLGLDVGSSVIRCHVYDRAGRVRGSSAQKVTGSGRRAVVRAAKASGRARFSCRRAATCSPALGPAAHGAGFAAPGQTEARAPLLAREARAAALAPGASPRSRVLAPGRSPLRPYLVGLQGPALAGPLQSPWRGALSLGFSCTSLIILQPLLRLYFKFSNLDRI